MITRRSFTALAASSLAFGPALAQSNRPLRIGVLNDMSSVASALTGESSAASVRMAVEDFGGKVLGRPIEVIAADHQNKPDVGLNIARGWFENEGVEAIFGLSVSSVALAVRNLAREKGKIDINTAAGTTDLTGAQCSATGFHWVYDTYSLARSTGAAIVKSVGDTFFFISADYTYGQVLQRDVSKFVLEAGGKVVGSVPIALGTNDCSAHLLRAQASGAKIIALATGGTDMINCIKQATEFQVNSKGQKVVSLVMLITDVNALGLQAAQGLLLTEAFYWDMNDETRAWSKRFFERRKVMPNGIHAGDYSAVIHYLKSVQAANGVEGKAVAATMRKMPVNDMATKNGVIRSDGRLLRDQHLFQVKTPAESSGQWDYYKHVTTTPGAEAFRPLAEGNCPADQQA